jgi:hypothetical protein
VFELMVFKGGHWLVWVRERIARWEHHGHEVGETSSDVEGLGELDVLLLLLSLLRRR